MTVGAAGKALGPLLWWSSTTTPTWIRNSLAWISGGIPFTVRSNGLPWMPLRI